MASKVTKNQVLSLYKTMLKESQKFPNYNFSLKGVADGLHWIHEAITLALKSSNALVIDLNRTMDLFKVGYGCHGLQWSLSIRSYAIRRVKDAFRDNKSLTEPMAIKKEYEVGQQNLELIKRQVVVGHMYKTEKLVIENLQ